MLAMDLLIALAMVLITAPWQAVAFVIPPNMTLITVPSGVYIRPKTSDVSLTTEAEADQINLLSPGSVFYITARWMSPNHDDNPDHTPGPKLPSKTIVTELVTTITSIDPSTDLLPTTSTADSLVESMLAQASLDIMSGTNPGFMNTLNVTQFPTLTKLARGLPSLIHRLTSAEEVPSATTPAITEMPSVTRRGEPDDLSIPFPQISGMVSYTSVNYEWCSNDRHGCIGKIRPPF